MRPKNAMVHFARLNVTVCFAKFHVLPFLRQLMNKAAPPQPWFTRPQCGLGKSGMQESRQLVREGAVQFTTKVIFTHGLSGLQSAETCSDFVQGGHEIRFRVNMFTRIVILSRNSHTLATGENFST